MFRAGLDGFDTVDAAFFFTVTDLTADLSNLLSFSSANVLLRLLTSQLNDVRSALQTIADVSHAAAVAKCFMYHSGGADLTACPLLVQAGLDVGLQLIWVDYTSTRGTFPPGGEPPNFQAVRTTLQVRARLLPCLDTIVAPQDVWQ